jgi:hypothetical protein
VRQFSAILGFWVVLTTPAFPDQLHDNSWRNCGKWLQSESQAAVGNTNQNLKLKFLQRILFRGSSLRQPTWFVGIRPESDVQKRGEQRTQKLFEAKRQQATPGKTYIPTPVFRVAQVEAREAPLPMLSLLEVARGIRAQSIALPVVFKGNRSVWGGKVAFLEGIAPHTVQIQFSTSLDGKKGAFRNHPQARNFLQGLGDAYAFDPKTSLATLKLDMSSPHFEHNFVEFFSLMAIDEYGFYDPGIFESKYDLLTASGRVFETRFHFAIQLSNGRVFAQNTPEFIEMMRGALDLVTPVANFLEPLQDYYSSLDLQTFQPAIEKQVIESLKQVGQRILTLLPASQNSVLWAEVDLGWVRGASPEQPEPVLIESHLALHEIKK